MSPSARDRSFAGSSKSLGGAAVLLWHAGRLVAICIAIFGDGIGLFPSGVTGGQEPPAAEEQEDSEWGDGVFLPSDRSRQRQIDQIDSLVQAGRWSDAATLLDTVIASEEDFFIETEEGDGRTLQSARSEALRMIAELPRAGRDAYELQFRGRAERMLAEAISANDPAAIVGVARRWLHTPAGRQAGLLTVDLLLESGQPLAAAIWLDRLAEDPAADGLQPLLSIMRGVALVASGDDVRAAQSFAAARGRRHGQTRIGGTDVELAGEPGPDLRGRFGVSGPAVGAGEQDAATGRAWLMHRGDAARNAVSSCNHPLLVPRYRVPLTLHPDEARLLEERRRLLGDHGHAALPAVEPLIVQNRIITRSSAGLLAIDFDTGKRLWLRGHGVDRLPSSAAAGGGPREDEGLEHAGLDAIFEDATFGTLASDGRLVFAVESDPGKALGDRGLQRLQAAGRNLVSRNELVAYDVAEGGNVRWRLPASGAELAGGNEDWFLGPPLPIGGHLHVLVESRGGVRLDVLNGEDGQLLWSQPLAELDEDHAVGRRMERRRAGVSPSAAEGVLVCPTAAGAVVAIDLATRSLLWAYRYPTVMAQDVAVLPNGIRFRRGVLAGGRVVIRSGVVSRPLVMDRWLETTAVVAGDRVLLAAAESDQLHCLDLRRGTLLWQIPREEMLCIAGVVGETVVLAGRQSAQAIALADGRPLWPSPLAFGEAALAGRGILTPDLLFLPLDDGSIIEIDLAGGRISGRSEGHGGGSPGNLLAYRGEVIAQAAATLEVFHQLPALDAKVETALRADPQDRWARGWRGQADLERGLVREGILAIRDAAGDGSSVAAERVAEAIHFGLRREFQAAMPLWEEGVRLSDNPATAASILRIAIDGLLAAGRNDEAWKAWQQAADRAIDETSDAAPDRLVGSLTDLRLEVTETRWLAGRLREIRKRSPPGGVAEIDRETAARLTVRAGDNAGRSERLERCLDMLADTPAEAAVRAALSGLPAGGRVSDDLPDERLRREVLQASAATSPDDLEQMTQAWPLGVVRIENVATDVDPNSQRIDRKSVIPVEHAAGSLLHAAQLLFDPHQNRLELLDGWGRQVGDPLPLEEDGGQLRQTPRAVAIGRVLVLELAGGATAFAIDNSPVGGRHRRLWSLETRLAGHGLVGAGNRVRRGRPRSFFRPLGTVPLGHGVGEPGGLWMHVDAVGSVRLGTPRTTGLPLLADGALQLRDAVSGRLLWQRHRVPQEAELFGDDEVLCIAGNEESTILVVSMFDGREMAKCDQPARERRLATAGRKMLVIEDAGAVGDGPSKVVLAVLDPLSGERIPVGEYAAGARGALMAEGRFAVLEPSGQLHVIAIASAGIESTARLQNLPANIRRFDVQTWRDRHFVVVDRTETAEEGDQLQAMGTIQPLPMAMQHMIRDGEGIVSAVTGSIWCLDRATGDPLWDAPATILAHFPVTNRSADLPVLLFARKILPRRPGEQPRLSVLCLDKRTGHAVYVNDTSLTATPALFDCWLSGDATSGRIVVSASGVRGGEVVLRFTGEPAAPQPPFQAALQPPVAGTILNELQYWLQRAIEFSF